MRTTHLFLERFQEAFHKTMLVLVVLLVAGCGATAPTPTPTQVPATPTPAAHTGILIVAMGDSL